MRHIVEIPSKEITVEITIDVRKDGEPTSHDGATFYALLMVISSFMKGRVADSSLAAVNVIRCHLPNAWEKAEIWPEEEP